MHPVLVRYFKIKNDLDLNRISNSWGVLNGSFQSERDKLAHALGCPFCARNGDGDWYKRACEYIVFVLKRNEFDVKAVIDQLNKLCSERSGHERLVAVVNDDGSIDFINGCTNGVYDILEAAAELID
jgi:hypothetical protein